MDDPRLTADVRQAADGDPDALQRLIVHYHATLRGVVAAAIDAPLRRHLDPDDLLQRAYINVFKTLNQNRDRKRAAPPTRDRNAPEPSTHRFDGPAHLYKWLEQIALNQLKDAQRALRRHKRDVARELPDRPDPTASYPDLVQRLAAGDSTPSRMIAKDEAIAAVMTCLARLSDDQREVVRLRILEDVPAAEIARRLGKSNVAIYALCRRGLKSLQELMGPITRYLTHL